MQYYSFLQIYTFQMCNITVLSSKIANHLAEQDGKVRTHKLNSLITILELFFKIEDEEYQIFKGSVLLKNVMELF